MIIDPKKLNIPGLWSVGKKGTISLKDSPLDIVTTKYMRKTNIV
jgi:hypothetical protein